MAAPWTAQNRPTLSARGEVASSVGPSSLPLPLKGRGGTVVAHLSQG